MMSRLYFETLIFRPSFHFFYCVTVNYNNIIDELGIYTWEMDQRRGKWLELAGLYATVIMFSSLSKFFVFPRNKDGPAISLWPSCLCVYVGSTSSGSRQPQFEMFFHVKCMVRWSSAKKNPHLEQCLIRCVPTGAERSRFWVRWWWAKASPPWNNNVHSISLSTCRQGEF